MVIIRLRKEIGSKSFAKCWFNIWDFDYSS